MINNLIVLNPADINVSELKLHKFSLKIDDQRLEKQFNLTQIKASQSLFVFIFCQTLIASIIYILVDNYYFKEQSQVYQNVRLIVLVIFSVVFIACLFFRLSDNHYYTFVKLILFLGIGTKIGFDWAVARFGICMTSTVVSLVSTFNFNMGVIFTVILNIMNSVNCMVRIIMLYFHDKYGVHFDDVNGLDLLRFYALTSFFVLLFFITLMSFYLIYKNDKEQRNDFLSKEQIKVQRNDTDKILQILVPKFVHERLVTSTSTQINTRMAKDQDDVAILFGYICDFQKIIKSEQETIVQLLDQLFREFDKLCEQFGVQKIETVGETYLAATGIKECECQIDERFQRIDKGLRLIQMAFEMKRIAEGFKWGPQKDQSIIIKVGINRGKVIAGLIGHHKPQFSLIGDNVNRTSRFASKAQYGQIQISESVYKHVKKSQYSFDKRVVFLKGIGEVEAYVARQIKPKYVKLFHRLATMVKEGKLRSQQEDFQLKQGNSFQQSIGLGSILKQNLDLSRENNQKSQSKSLKRYVTGVAGFKQKISLQEFSNPTEALQKLENIEEDSILLEQREKLENEESHHQKYLKYNPIFLTILPFQKDIEHFYKQNLKQGEKKAGPLILIVLFIVYLFQTLMIITIKGSFKNADLFFQLRGAFLGVLMIIIVYYDQCYKKRWIKTFALIVFTYGSLVSLYQAQQNQQADFKIVQLLEDMFVVVSISNLNVFEFYDMILFFLANILYYFIHNGLADTLVFETFMFFICYNLFLIQKIYINLLHTFNTFNNLQERNYQLKQLEGLVDQLLPAHALQKLKTTTLENKLSLTDRFDDVTLLYADISGFTDYSKEVEDPIKVVQLLSQLFTGFDKSCLKHQVFKLYTIGDCYVVLGFLNAAKRSKDTIVVEAQNVVQMGLSMLRHIEQVKKEVYSKLAMRIGIHTGTIIAGIIGTDIVRYDIYGRDALIANKMESEGKADNLMVSEATKLILEKDESNPYEFHSPKEVKFNDTESIQAFLVKERIMNSD